NRPSGVGGIVIRYVPAEGRTTVKPFPVLIVASARTQPAMKNGPVPAGPAGPAGAAGTLSPPGSRPSGGPPPAGDEERTGTRGTGGPRWSGRTLLTLWSDSSGRPDWPLGAARALRSCESLRSGGSRRPNRPLRSRESLRSGGSGRSNGPLRSRRACCACRSLWARWPLWPLRTLRAWGPRGPCRACRALGFAIARGLCTDDRHVEIGQPVLVYDLQLVRSRLKRRHRGEQLLACRVDLNAGQRLAVERNRGVLPKVRASHEHNRLIG